MHPTLTHMAAQQRIEDLRREADRYRLARASTPHSRSSRLAIAWNSRTGFRSLPLLQRLSLPSATRR